MNTYDKPSIDFNRLFRRRCNGVLVHIVERAMWKCFLESRRYNLRIQSLQPRTKVPIQQNANVNSGPSMIYLYHDVKVKIRCFEQETQSSETHESLEDIFSPWTGRGKNDTFTVEFGQSGYSESVRKNGLMFRCHGKCVYITTSGRHSYSRLKLRDERNSRLQIVYNTNSNGRHNTNRCFKAIGSAQCSIASYCFSVATECRSGLD